MAVNYERQIGWAVLQLSLVSTAAVRQRPVKLRETLNGQLLRQQYHCIDGWHATIDNPQPSIARCPCDGVSGMQFND